jgi:uncharacterized sulfatase
MVNTKTDNIYAEWLKQTENDHEKHQFVLKYKQRPKEELYDLSNDPYEMKNLAENSEYTSVKNSLIRELGDWMKVQGDEGIATEMNALNRMPRNLDGNWQGHEDDESRKILFDK